MGPKTEDLRESRATAVLSILRDVTGVVLETMFFSEAVPRSCDHAELDAPGAQEEWISARVLFDGAPRGELRVMLSHELARFIAADGVQVPKLVSTRVQLSARPPNGRRSYFRPAPSSRSWSARW